MLWDIPHEILGFDLMEWDAIPRGDKAIIRDYYLNGTDTDQTAIYGFWETTHQVRKAEKTYELENRPKLYITAETFRLPLY